MKKIVLTGATGMIGSAIVRESIAQGYQITCIVRKNTKRLENIPFSENVRIIESDINEYDSLTLEEKYDVFIHLAWEKTAGNGRDDVNLQLKNIQYTLDAVHLAKRCGCSVFIGAGSQAEYGICNSDLTPNTFCNPESGYGIAKYAAGKFSKMLCDQLGIRQNWIRILSVYGKNDNYYTLVSYVINELKNRRSPELTKSEQIWDYLNCEDAANAFLSIAEKGVDGKVYPLGSGVGRKLSEYLQIIRNVINPSIELGFGRKEYYPHQPMHLVADISELTADTGWKPKVGFEEGIKNILA